MTHFAIHSNHLFCTSPQSFILGVNGPCDSQTATVALLDLIPNSCFLQVWTETSYRRRGLENRIDALCWWPRNPLLLLQCVHLQCHHVAWVPEDLSSRACDRLLRLMVTYVWVSVQTHTCMYISGKMASLPHERSHHLLSKAALSLEFFKGKVIRKHTYCHLLHAFIGVKLAYPSLITSDDVLY